MGPCENLARVYPLGCVYVCVCWWGSVDSRRVLTTPLTQAAQVGRTFARDHPPTPWLLMWVVEGCEQNFARGSPLCVRGGMGIAVYCVSLNCQRQLPRSQLSYYGRSSNVGQTQHSLGLVQVDLSTSISGSHAATYVLKLFVSQIRVLYVSRDVYVPCTCLLSMPGRVKK